MWNTKHIHVDNCLHKCQNPRLNNNGLKQIGKQNIRQWFFKDKNKWIKNDVKHHMFVGFILFLKVFPRQVQMFHFVNAKNILPVECFATRITRKRLVSCMDPDVALERVFVSKWPQTVLALSVSHPCSRITWNIKIVCAIIILGHGIAYYYHWRQNI